MIISLKHKTIKKVLKIALWTFAVLLVLASALVFSLRFKSVQTYVAKRAARYLSKELNTRIEIESLYLKPFKSLVLEKLYVQDLEKDTLLYAPRFTVDLNLLSIKQRIISVNTVRLDGGVFHLKEYKDNKTNLQFILNYFDKGKPVPKDETSKKPYTVSIDKIELNKIAFKYVSDNRDTTVRGVNFDDVYLSELSSTILGLDVKNHLFKADVRGMSFKEKSGLHVKHLSTDATIDTNRMEYKNLLLETNRSVVKDYVLMKYNSFADFSNFVNKVYIAGNLKKSSVHSKDISFFTDAIDQMNSSFLLSGSVSGYVRDFKARKFSIITGKASQIQGDFHVKGLPAIDKTVFDLNIGQLVSNKKDVEYIVNHITAGNLELPQMLSRLGTIYYKGRFKGFYTDFNVKGTFKTSLGQLTPDVNLNLKNTYSYSGTVRAQDFDLGRFLDVNTLGRTTLTARVNGSGISLGNLKEDIYANAAYFDLKGYRYSNVIVDGQLVNTLFNGHIGIQDPNVKLAFDGSVNMDSKRPRFDFQASVKKANLHKLHLTKDTLQIDADLASTISGTDINNIQGRLDLKHFRMTSPDTSLVVNAVSLLASGSGVNRVLSVQSDILDANLKGQYDLNTIPSYFKTLAKNYIPSLKARIVRPGAQDFSLYINIKDFEPLRLLLVPQLRIPQGAIFYGRFNSADSIATLNGSSPLIHYGKLKFNNVIIDESTGRQTLDLFLTADRIDITDSLYIKNINIANILRNDSLSLNVKLSDKDATNQLDLNGLIEFGTDTLARLSLLPSDIVINNEVWRIPEKVQLRFDNGHVIVRDFELSRNNQILSINGMVSGNPKDRLEVDFKNFQLATFNSLTRAAGVNMSGVLNGNVSLFSITQKPKIEAALRADSVIMNNTRVGNLQMAADFDNKTKLINVEAALLKDGKETLNLAGTYNADAANNTLDLNLHMDDNELIVFEPAVRSLVSDLSGKVSADLNISGNVLDPSINGIVSFKNAGLTVNYLKTHYTLSNEVSIHNSIVQIDALELKDINGNRGIARGSVNLTNPVNPYIDVVVRADNFMALNTTLKDNPDYYGTAFATGSFVFKGYTDDMKIYIKAHADEGTVFNLPLNSSERTGENDYIEFVSKDSIFQHKHVSFLKGIQMDFDLTVDEKTQMNIITDLGILNGRGNAALNLKINGQGDFQMFGDYQLSSGKFQFTAQDFINKIFDLNEGGSVRWTGDPGDAQINIRAVYALRTDLRPLYLASGRAPQEGRVLSEAVMNLSGNLTQPEIAFDINFPNDTYLKDEFQSYFSDVNNKNTQALSLIVRRSFAPNTGLVNIEAVNSTLVSAGTELFFNQLNNILTQALNLNFVDINVRSLNEASASLRLWNDRLILSGGFTDRRSQLNDFNIVGNSIARDLEMQYLIRKDGSLTARLSNRLNNRNFLNPDQEYISAFGLVYRKEFETFGEFFKSMLRFKQKEESGQHRRIYTAPGAMGTPRTIRVVKKDTSSVKAQPAAK